MRYTVTAILILISLIGFTQERHIEQSQPFENILLALKTDSVPLFIESFSKRIIEDKKEKMSWENRLDSGKGKFQERFGDYELTDFTYEFQKGNLMLIIYFKGEMTIEMPIVKENRKWRLDMH